MLLGTQLRGDFRSEPQQVPSSSRGSTGKNLSQMHLGVFRTTRGLLDPFRFKFSWGCVLLALWGPSQEGAVGHRVAVLTREGQPGVSK
jgi:hypothetical protein